MNDTILQMLIFGIVSTIGTLTRLLYVPAALLQKKVGNKFFSAVLDIVIALFGAACMMLVCFLMAGSIRIFYAIFFLGGMITTHFGLKKADEFLVKRKAKKAKKLLKATDKAISGSVKKVAVKG